MKFFLMILAVMVAPLAALSQPAVTALAGGFDHGDTLYVYGTGFGSKDPAGPVVWDDFEHGTDGAGVGDPAIGEYSRVSADLHYEDTGVYSGSMSAYEYFDGSNWFNGVVANWIPHEAQNSFASMKVKFTSNTGTLAEPSSKLLRLNTWDPDATHGYPNFVIGMRGHSPSLEIITNIGAGWGDPGSETVGSVSEAEFDDPNGEWWGISGWMHVGDSGAANGMAGREFNGSIVEVEDIMILWDGLAVDYAGTRSAYFNGHMGLYGASWVEAMIDEVYADTTFARVVVSAASGGDEWGETAMQLPIYWSGTEVRVVVNTSRFASGETAYVRVVNEDGEYSGAYSVTVGDALGPPEDPGSTGVGVPVLTRTGADLDLTWTAPSTTPDHYAVYVREGGASVARRIGVTESVNMNNIAVASTGQVDVYVVAYAADGSIISTSNVVTDTP